MTPQETQQKFYELLLQSQYWSPERLASYQHAKLAQLLRHARRNVPFYEKRLDPVFRPDGGIDLSRWHELPIVRRSDMVQHRDAMQARAMPPGHGAPGIISTSGSTGMPIKVTVNAMMGITSGVFVWRLHGWQGLDWSKTMLSRLGDGDHRSQHPDGERRGVWGPRWLGPGKLGASWRISREFDTPTMLDFFVRFGASYLNAGPNMAHINAIDAKRLGLSVKIDAVLVQGNVVRDADRAAVREVFGARMIEHYSSKEGGQIAHPCPEGTLHINGEGCLVEVLDEAGRPCGPGETGRVVITPFFQTAQPLIRYEQGDWATLGGPCPCGRHSPTIKTILGRSIAIFQHPDGRSVANLMPDETANLLGSSLWQLAQVGPNEYEMRYIPLDHDAPGDETAVRDLFHKTYFADAGLAFRRVETMALSKSGKLADYVNEWRPVN